MSGKTRHDRLWEAIRDLQLLRSEDQNVRETIGAKKIKLSILELDHVLGFLVERSLEVLQKESENEKNVTQEGAESGDLGIRDSDAGLSSSEPED